MVRIAVCIIRYGIGRVIDSKPSTCTLRGKPTPDGTAGILFRSTGQCGETELTATLHNAGFVQVRWLMPADSSFYQPIILGRYGD
jgi:hypothetical protein